MARMRSVKPEFWTDRKLARVSRDARLLYIALWNQADEWARVHGDTRYVKGHCLPYDDDLSLGAIDRLLEELAGAGHVQRYDFAGDPYLHLPKLPKHQRLEPHKVPSRLPEPPDPANPQVTDVSGSRANESARRSDESAPDADSSETNVALHVAGGMKHVAGSRGQVAPPAAAPLDGVIDRLADDLAPNAAGVVRAYVDACRETEQILDNRAKGRIAKEAAQLLTDGAPFPLLVEAARRLAVNGFADLGAEARRIKGEQNKPSTTDQRVRQGMALVEHFSRQEGA